MRILTITTVMLLALPRSIRTTHHGASPRIELFCRDEQSS